VRILPQPPGFRRLEAVARILFRPAQADSGRFLCTKTRSANQHLADNADALPIDTQSQKSRQLSTENA
jgi:hypothetical protein